MVDDDNDKTRRNLVVWSAAIIAVWSLDIRIGQVAGEVWVLKGSGAAPWKLWMAASLVHAYLWVRYRFSPDGVQTQASWALSRRELFDEYVWRRLRTEAVALGKNRLPTRSWITKLDTVQALREQFTPKQTDSGISWEVSAHESTAVAAGHKASTRKLFGEFLLIARTLAGGHPQKSQRQRIEVPKLRSLAFGLRARVVAALYSEASAKAVLPRILAAIAAAVLAWQLGAVVWALVSGPAA